MRRILAFAAAAFVFVALAVPASAVSVTGPPPNPTCVLGPCQENDHFTQLELLGSPLDCPTFPGWAVIDVTGNGVQHININAAQDFWFTTTMTGAATIRPVLVLPNPDPTQPPTIIGPDPGHPVLTGQLEAWFAIQGNRSNFSTSDTANFHGTAPDGTSFSLHLNTHTSSIPANPFVPHIVVMDVHC